MTPSTGDAPDAEQDRVYLLRLWRDHGPWHASLQAADAVAPHRFADVEALIAFLRGLVPLPSQAAPAPPPDGTADKEAGAPEPARCTPHPSGTAPYPAGVA